ncbi:MAG: 2-octaprenyl-6-methoxyphenyl hydroxylase [Halioglobus sp.]
MQQPRHIVIAGGGMVGVSLALMLGHELPSDIRITLVESFALPEDTGAPAYHPSFDARSTALSYSSCAIYEQMGVWPDLAQWVCPIATVHVSNRGRFGSTLLSAQDYGWDALGYVVENAWLGRALLYALRQQERVELINPANVAAATPMGESVELSIEGDDNDTLTADLLVVADGADSSLRKALGVGTSEKPYGQSALIANIALGKGHAGCAFERFTDEGPLALLPLVGVPDAKERSALVWTLPPERAAQLMDCSPTDFLQALQSRFGYRLGRLQRVGERFQYPLTLLEAHEQVRQGIVVMGNAAHALHPVAGQGFNLALRDVAQLSACIGQGIEQQRSPGDLSVLKQYQELQADDQRRTIAFSDKVPGLFMHPDPVLSVARDLALAGLDISPPLKRAFVRHAAGIAAMASPNA